MNYSQRIEIFSKLGDMFLQVNAELPLLQQAYLHNNWFTIDMQLRAFHAWGQILTKENLEIWLRPYQLEEKNSEKTIAIIMAGNIPLVGFHDLLCVLITGNKALIKLSSDDQKLMKWVLDQIVEIESNMTNYIQIAEDYQLKNFDAVIATGSNNSNRYFEYYFRNTPRLLRKNRNSLAILSGQETTEELDALSDDVFQYFGLGCRNVSKLLVPVNYNLEPMFIAFERYKEIINHNKYANNYTYHKALFLMNQDVHLDNGFLLLKQDEGLASPLSVLLFQIYENEQEIEKYLKLNIEKIQCIVGSESQKGWVQFGKSQQPELWDYADGVDIIMFLEKLIV